MIVDRQSVVVLDRCRLFLDLARTGTACDKERCDHRRKQQEAEQESIDQAGRAEHHRRRTDQRVADDAPSPVGNGHAPLRGQQPAKPAAITVQSTQLPNRNAWRSKPRWVSLRQPHTAIGNTSMIAPNPTTTS